MVFPQYDNDIIRYILIKKYAMLFQNSFSSDILDDGPSI